MEKEKLPKKEQKKNNFQGDNAIRRANQVQASFLYVPLKDPFEKRLSPSLKRNLYRVVKIK